MKKKELAKLLFQHKDIKALFESRQFDASTLKRVISEEIMREAEGDDGWKSDNSEETQAMVAQIEDLKATLDEFKGRLDDVKSEFTQAKVDRDRPAMKNLADEKKMIASDIDHLEVQIRRLEADLQIAYKAAGKTPEKEDDLQVAKIAAAVKDTVSTAADNMSRSASNPDEISKIAKDTKAKLGTAIRASDAVVKNTVQSSTTPQPTADYDKTIDAIKNVKTPQATTPTQVSTELISKNTGIGFSDDQARTLIMNPIVAATRKLYFLAGLTFGIENLTIGDVMYYVSGNESYSPRASQALKQLEKTVGEKQWKDRVKGFTSMNKEKRSAAISNMEGKELEIVKTIIQRELDAAKSILSAGGVSMKPFAEQEAGSSAPSPQAPPTKPKGRKSKGGVRMARKAIAGEDVETSDITPQDVKAAVVQDSEEIKSDPEMKQNAKDLMQQVQASEEETTPQLPAGKGWKNAKTAARKKVTEGTTIEQIAASLESADAFKDFWGVKGEVDAKMEQAKGLFDDGYFAKRIEELRGKATEENKDEVVEKATSLAATVMGYMDYLNTLEQPPQFKEDFIFPEALPTTEEEFKKEFIEPITPEGATVGTSPQDYIAIADQVIAQASDLLSTEDLAVEGMKEFIGWYVAGRSTGSLNEEIVGLNQEYNTRLNSYDGTGRSKIMMHINKNTEKWNDIFTKLDDLVRSGKIKINKSDEPAEDPDKEVVGLVDKQMVQDVIQNTPEVEPDADADLSPLATEEMDAAWTTTLDVFFGKSREKSSFMRQFLLKNQASMLYGMIDVLGQITTGGAGGEERSLSNEKTQVKRKEEPVAPSAEDEKKEEPPKTNTPTDTEDEAEVQKESLEEQVINEIFGMFGGKDNEDKEIKFSPKSTSLMRQDLEAMVDLLRSLKTDIGQYKKYSTSSSVDPRFDGSTLKRAMDAKLKVVQQSIAHLTKVIDLEVQSQKDQLKADGAQAAQDSVDLQEATGSDRKVRIAEVEKVYNEMRRQYLKGLKVSLSSNDAEKAKAGAKELKDYVMGQETFMSYFPSNIITSSGGVMTLGAAHESMVAIIAPFIETIRDIVTITKTQKVSESNLQQAIGNLVMISDSIESMFKVPSLIDREFMQKYIEAAKQNPDNQPLTDEEPGMMDKARELTGKALDKLKQMFSWMSDETRKLLLKFFGEDSELIDGLSNSDLSDDDKQKIVEEVEVAIGFLQNLKDAEEQAVNKLFVDMGKRGAQLAEEVFKYTNVRDFERQLSSKFDSKLKEILFISMNEALSDEERDLVVGIMRNKQDEFVSFMTTFFKIKEKLGKEAAEEMVNPKKATITQGDQDPNAEDEIPEPENLGKDNSELEDVDGFDDSEKTDDSDTPEDEDDIADFNREVQSVDEFLPRLKEPTNPIAKQIQTIKDGFVNVLTKQRKIPTPRANALFNKFFLLIFKQMNKDLVMEDKDQFAKTLIPKIKQDTKRFISSLGSDELKIRDFDIFFENIKEADLIELIALVRKHKVKIAKIVYGESGQVDQDNSEKAVRGKEVNLEEALRPIIEKMLNEHYNH